MGLDIKSFLTKLGAKNVNCHSASATPRHKRTICANTNFNYSELFIASSLLTIKSSAKKFSTNTKIFSSAGFHVHHHLMLNIYKCWNKKNPVKILNTMYTIVIQHCWIVKNSAQLQKFSAVLNFMYTLASVMHKYTKDNWCWWTIDV